MIARVRECVSRLLGIAAHRQRAQVEQSRHDVVERTSIQLKDALKANEEAQEDNRRVQDLLEGVLRTIRKDKGGNNAQTV